VQHLAKCRHLGGALLLRLAGGFRQKAPKFLLQTAPPVRRSILKPKFGSSIAT